MLPIEWAFARTFRKKTMVVHSKKLHPEVWKSVNPDIAQIEYVEVKFGSETVPQILRYCREHFIDEGRTVVPFRPRKAAQGGESAASPPTHSGESKHGRRLNPCAPSCSRQTSRPKTSCSKNVRRNPSSHRPCRRSWSRP